MVKLKQEYKDNSIPVSELKDGQIGIITDWNHKGYMGCIVQRYGDNIITVGKGIDSSCQYIPTNTDCRVRIIEDGTELIITNNQ